MASFIRISIKNTSNIHDMVTYNVNNYIVKIDKTLFNLLSKNSIITGVEKILAAID